MNIDIFCSRFKAIADDCNKMHLIIYDVDKKDLLDSVTDRFTLVEILNEYDKDFVKEMVGKL